MKPLAESWLQTGPAAAEHTTMQVHDKTFEIYIHQQDIQARVHELGQQIAKDYAGKKPILVGVLNGAFIFLADLARAIPLDVEVSFIRFASYSGTQSTGKIVKFMGFDDRIKGKDIILVEDIVDTGHTMQYLLGEILAFSPNSVAVATLLFKKAALQVETKIDYTGFEIDNKFVLGYGLDYDELGRNLEHIYILKG